MMSEFDICVFLNRGRAGFIDHGFASSVVDINVSVFPEIAGHVSDRLHDHMSCNGSTTLGSAFMTTGYFAYTSFCRPVLC